MDKDIKRGITNIILSLKASGKFKLAKCIEENWQKKALTYSKELNSYKPEKAMEEEMSSAFYDELLRTGLSDKEAAKVLASIKKRRTLETANHLGVTENPRMLCINWLGSLGTPDNEYYVVAMFSGIPFSNHTRPGRINRKIDSINLFPSNMQDALVYGSVMPKKLVESVAKLPHEIKKFLPEAQIGDLYTKWALLGCQNIERKIIKKTNLIYLDINEVVTNYLSLVLRNKNHVFHKIFFDPKTRNEFVEIFPEEIMFYSSNRNGKYETMDGFVLDGLKLKNKELEIALDNPEILINELKNGRLCPALIPGFLAIAFLNQFNCFGSFVQVEYLPTYQEKMLKLKSLKEYSFKHVPTSSLTTGTFPGANNLYPVDIIMGEKFTPKPDILFGELLLPMQELLINSYFTGDARKTTRK